MRPRHLLALQLLLVSLMTLPSWGQKFTDSGGHGKDKTSASAASAASLDPNDPNNFTIGSEDALAINVWKEPEVSRVVVVRSDGKISLPLVGEIQATGKTPLQLQAEIAKSLAAYIPEPGVTVIVQNANSKKYSIVGRIGHAGTFPLTSPMTVLDAIAGAGGFQQFAKLKKIYVLRIKSDGHEERIPFNYSDVIRGKHLEQNIELQARDIIVVP